MISIDKGAGGAGGSGAVQMKISGITVAVSPMNAPSAYRIGKRDDGTPVLMGAFYEQSANGGQYEWREVK